MRLGARPEALYEQMLFAYIDLPPRAGENLEALAERVRMIRNCRRDLRAPEAKMSAESSSTGRWN